MTGKRCGYVALLGLPNAGKSTLLNAVLGCKVAGVSRKPQTTRNAILGVHSEGDGQLIFQDTPGLLRHERDELQHRMMAAIPQVVADSDVVCFLIPAHRPRWDEALPLLEKVRREAKGPVFGLLSQADRMKGFEVRAVLGEWKRRMPELEVLPPLSAKDGDAVAAFRRRLLEHLPEGEWLFPEDQVTDRPRSFVVSELVREQLFRHLGEELPYGCGVVVDRCDEAGDRAEIWVTILVARESHKGMVVGRKGRTLGAVRVDAEKALRSHWPDGVLLHAHVKTASGWVDRPDAIAEIQGLEA